MHQFISYEEIGARAPAALATEKAVGLSNRYSFISTRGVIDRLGDLGWFPVAAYQNRSKDPVHATHMITFRTLHTLHTLDLLEVGDLIPQIMFIGNHAGRKSASLPSGFERLACKNGLTVATSLGEEVFIQIHKGLAELGIQDAVARACKTLRGASADVSLWRDVELNLIEQAAFAESALRLRYSTPLMSYNDAGPLLQRRRDADQGNDLWTVFNVVQENLTQGGVRGVFGQRRSLRKVAGITPGQRINQGLWSLARRFAHMFRKS